MQNFFLKSGGFFHERVGDQYAVLNEMAAGSVTATPEVGLGIIYSSCLVPSHLFLDLGVY